MQHQPDAIARWAANGILDTVNLGPGTLADLYLDQVAEFDDLQQELAGLQTDFDAVDGAAESLARAVADFLDDPEADTAVELLTDALTRFNEARRAA